MKLKGVNPIEQHIEKIVLGIVMIILLGVVAIQFVTRPNDISDGGRTIAPAQVYTALEPQANQLQSQLTDLSPVLPEVKPVDLVDRYNSAFADSGTDRLVLSAPLGMGTDVTSATGASVRDVVVENSGPVNALQVPSTSVPVAASQWATLDPYAVETVPEYAGFVPSQQPFDFPSISVQATFSGTELASVLDGNNGSNPIPRRFWSTTGIAILGFDAERQMQMPDGSWGPSEPIVTPPHTPMPTNAIDDQAGLQDLTEVVRNASRVMDDVVRPIFPPTIAGVLWAPPSERVASGNESESSRVKRLQRQLERARGELDRLTGIVQPGPDPRNNPGGGKTGGRDDRRPPPPSNPRQNQDRVKKVQDQIKKLEEQLKELGVDLGDNQPAARVRTSRNDIRSVLEEESIDLWAHDLGVKPGATYRYRTRVVVNNPLFRKGGELDPDDAGQQALAEDPFARGQWSGWSDPVVAGAKEYFFVTGADLGQATANSDVKATIELYQMYFGHYRRSTLSVSPGDELATSVRVSGELLMFDTESLPVTEAAKYVQDLGSDQTSDRPEGIDDLPSRVTIDMGVYMLDVYAGQASEEADLVGRRSVPMRVVLRDRDGAVLVRTDLDDESSLAYALASGSASSASSTPLRAPGEPAISPSAALFEPAEP